MPEAKSQSWYLRIDPETQYGPVDVATLVNWATSGKVMADDDVSQDGETWVKADTVAELEMDTYIQRPDGVTLGPFHAKAIAALEFEGHFPEGSRVFKKEGEGVAAVPNPAAATPVPKPKSKRKEKPMSEPNKEEPPVNDAENEEGLSLRMEEMAAEARDAMAERNRDIETLRQTLAEKDAELATLRHENASLVSRLASLETETETLRAALKKADETATATIENLRATLRKAEEKTTTSTSGLTREIEILRQTQWKLVEAHEEERGRFRIAVKAAEEKTAAATEAKDEMRTELETLRAEHQELLTFSNDRDAELTAKVAELSIVPKEGEEARRAWQAEAQNTGIKRDLDELRRKYERDLAESETRRVALEQQLKEITKREEVTKNQFLRLQQSEGDYASLSSQLKRRENTILRMERDAEAARAKAKEIENALLRRIDELEHSASTLFKIEDVKTEAAKTEAAKPETAIIEDANTEGNDEVGDPL